MMQKMFVVFDSKACTYNVPFCFPERGMAVRSFTDLARDKDNLIGKHPEDFTLFQVGEYDTDTGTVIPLVPHVTLLKASEVRTED